jgi:histidinol-phosphate aminotransferase
MTQGWPEWLQINDNLRDLSPYGAPQIDSPVRLNTNENPYNLDPTLQASIVAAISENVSHLNRYPDRDAIALREELALFINESSGTTLNSANVWAANGSNEILQSIALAFKGSAMGFEPSYSMHPLISRAVGKSALLVVDEAYAEFSSSPSAVTLISDYPNILVSRTMSKAFAFAGARLGYLIAQPAVIDAMLLIRLPYHLSDLTQAAALAALQERMRLRRDVEQIKVARDGVATELLAMGLKVLHSDANFLLFTGFTKSAQEIWNALVDKGVLIRDVGIPGHLRVTIGTTEENRAFVSALSSIL